ncbi:MAG: hypothetical protein NZM37_02690 [Sandaracinaceae bacterium]|nr:hypothetical protein [Sandaracinaceae bacterium]
MRRWFSFAFSLLFACARKEASCKESELAPISEPYLALLLSDYASTQVVIQKGDGTLFPWIDSGTRPPRIVATLSGDVVFPRSLPSKEILVLIDRFQTDVLTVIPFSNPSALFQRDLRGGRTSGTSPNPHDLLALRDGRWVITRFNPPERSGVSPIAHGNDLLILDANHHEIEGRVDLRADTEIDGVIYYARPSGLARLEENGEEYVLVGLARLSSFTLRRTGPGALALWHPPSGRVEILELPGLSNCGAVASAPSAPSFAFALCRGDAFSESPPPRAGLVQIRIQGGHLLELRRATPELIPSLPHPSNGLIPITTSTLLYVSSGSFENAKGDRLVAFDFESGEAQVIFESDPPPFELGEGALDVSNEQALIPEGNTLAILRFKASSPFEQLPSIRLDHPCLRLPPRQVLVITAQNQP